MQPTSTRLFFCLYNVFSAADAQKIATPAKVNGRLTGHVTFYEQELLLSRQKRQTRGGGRGRRPRPQGPRPTPAPQAATTNPTPAAQTTAATVPTTPAAAPTAATTVITPNPTTLTTPADSTPPEVTTVGTATCGTEVYRSADGSCNNKDEPSWGAKDSTFQRLLQPVYSETNNVYGPVLTSTVDGSALPSPRLISRIIHDPLDRPERRPVMNMQWGQFLDHDITSTPVNPSSETCCYDGIVASGVTQHPHVAQK
ncbi:chorion peroxidase [Elysia marginata]|uniref:Chorion peroxidase n=1 Tax=Elysia marginata TaxID=1093978 RepID=A0AAV4GXS7_9GAST|nr:chorion peroxidase [Elysia marginata]